MNDETPYTAIGDEPVEARIVSWVLGEASAFEAAELERLCEERPELLVFRRRMRALHGLLTEAESAEPDESWKLPAEKRKVLDEIFGEEKSVRLEVEKEKRIRHSGRRAFLAIAACLILTVVVAGLLATGRADIQKARRVSNAQRYTPASEKPSSEIRERQLEVINKAVRDQEDKVEERRKVLSTIARTKGIIYRGNDTFYDRSGVDEDQGARGSIESSEVMKDESREEAIKRGLDAQDYADAKREFENDQELLQAMKLKQIEKTFDDQVAQNSSTPQFFRTEAKKSKAALTKPGAPTSSAVPGISAAKPSSPVAMDQLAVRDAGVKSVFLTGKSPSPARAPRPRVDPSTVMEDLVAERLRLESDVVFTDPPADSGNGKDFGAGWAGGVGNLEVANDAKPAPVTAPSRSRSTADPFVDENGRLAGLDARQPASGPIGALATESQIQIARETRYPAEFESPAMPGIAFQSADSSYEGAFPITPATPTTWMSGNGDDSVDLYAYDLKQEHSAPAGELAKMVSPPTLSLLGGDRSNLGDTLNDVGGFAGEEDEYQTKYTSEFRFRGLDLGKDKAKPALVPLVDLMEEIPAAEDPYSTFSLNISDASFQIAQAALAKGEQPDPAAIKVEQFYNAVDYGDPAPSANEPVAVNIEQSAHPVIPGRNLVRIALKTAAAGRSASQPLRLTLLVDQSGSMVREDRRTAMNKALAGLSELLTKNDLVTVIGFSRTPHLLADGMTGDKAGNLAELVNQSASEGGTNLEEAIKLAEQVAGRQQLAGAQNRIVLFTDGAANLGNADPERLAEKVKQLRQKGIAFDIAGIAADGLNDELLGELARNGNGRYYVVGKGADGNFAKQLAGAFRPAAENVKVQVHFNPERVGRYKLIGFEKDRLKTEDFRNDKVDAAELAAEEAGVAIYQVEPLADGHGELGEVSVRFRDTASGQMVERTWTVPHDTSAPAIDRAMPSMQLAVLSMLAGEKLKGGPLADAIDFKQLTGPRANVKQFYGSTGGVGEMLRMVDVLK